MDMAKVYHMQIPFNPQPVTANTSIGLDGIMPVRRVQYSAPEQPAPARADPGRVSAAIRQNETGGVKNPYSFRQPSGNPAMGMANGAYQVTDAELRSYAPLYLGRPVTSQQFLASPQLQDQYMNVKATNLAARGLTPQEIMAVHRGGSSDLTASALSSMVTRYQPYVTKGMTYYDQAAAPPATPARSFADLSAQQP